MASSSFYKGKIDEFNALKTQLKSLFGSIETCFTAVTKSRGYLDNIVICGETIDKGVLENNVSTAMDGISDVVNTLISECSVKIGEYTDLYNEALAAEEREARKKEGWFTWI